MSRNYSEDSLVEQPAIELFKELGWEAANCYHETFGAIGTLGRETAAEVLLVSRLKPTLNKLNPELPPEAIDNAIEELTRDRSAMSLAEANRQIYKLLKNGVRVDVRTSNTLSRDPSGSAPSPQPSPRGRGSEDEEVVRVKVIDWEHPENNDFFLASQLWLTGDVYKRRADLVGFVNGLPLVFIELKKLRTEDAFHHNLRDYKNTIPKLFWYNAFIILSHGSKSLIGSLTAGLDHFAEWKKINDEGEEGVVSLDTMIRGTCEPAKLLDLVENFILFSESEGGLLKLVAKNHQYLGVNRAIAAVQRMLRTPTPNPSPKGGGEEEELMGDVASTKPSSFAPSPQPSPKGRGSKARQYRGGYQFAGLVNRARELRQKQTPAEAMLWELLRNRGLLEFKFRRQHQFGDYIADFYCHEAQLVVECDGSAHDPNEQWQHDQNRDAYMIAQGLRVLRFTNERILNDTEQVLEEICSYLPMLHTLSPTPLPRGEGQLPSVNDLPSPGGRGAGGEGLQEESELSRNLLPSTFGGGVGGGGAELGGAPLAQHGGARLGVFWHTQGSGKSYSMVFFSQKILRKLTGNWTFLVVTDREDLDDQIYKNFAGAGAVTEPENQVRADSGKHLKQLLREDHRFIFTLIQKFHTPQASPSLRPLSPNPSPIAVKSQQPSPQPSPIAVKSQQPSPQPSPKGSGGIGVYPMLSDRSDIIVITDEAHRSQYDQLALNMRNALPNAAFIAFTGTPLMAGEERTKEVFGDYISVYNFKQSVDDHATVPLFYENRIPELQLVNEELNEDMAQVIEEADLTEEQEEKLEREFAREYHLITRDDRLEKVAEDIVRHFTGRGFQGKAMVISIDKAAAVRMYDKVQKYWQSYLRELESKLSSCPEDERASLEAKVAYMRETDMAVVVSQSQNEVEDLAEKGADIVPHRKRLLKEDLDTKFKDANDPLRLVFVCAMWITGFDVPSCSTIYLDKPMRNHTLMQTIARANRVFKNKVNGLIVDYVGVFRNLQKALAIYGTGSGGGLKPGETPVKDKQELVGLLRSAIGAAEEFCSARWVDLPAIRDATGFTRVKLLDDAVEAIVENDESKEQYRSVTNNVSRLYKAILPDPLANEFGQINLLLSTIQDKIQALVPVPDISEVLARVEDLLDESIASEGYVIHEADRIVDLSKIDFEALQKQFAKGRKHTEVERLRNALAAKLAEMVMLNRSRMDYLEHFQQMIDEYNSGAVNVEVMFERLVKFTKELNAEEQRHIGEQLSVEELAVFDLLTKPEISLSKKEREQVKKVARELLQTLKREKLVLDWRAKQQSRAAVRLAIEETLDLLPRVFPKQLYAEKCDLVYQHVFDSYFGFGRGVYSNAA